MQGVSVNVAPGKSAAVATANFPNKRVGTSTVGAITKAGGTVVASPTKTNPYHADLSGITPALAASLFQPNVALKPTECAK